jgi:glutamyl-tRNA synthetase
MAPHFDLARVSHSAAHFDEAQLRHWQREAVQHADEAAVESWLGGRLDSMGDAARRREFVRAVRGNLLFPGDVDALVAVVARDRVEPEGDARQHIAEAGAEFFLRAADTFPPGEGGFDFKTWTRALGEATGRKGARLFMPLRAALTGDTHGPELAPLIALMGGERALARLRAAAATLTPTS